jgi:hypothetical protein
MFNKLASTYLPLKIFYTNVVPETIAATTNRRISKMSSSSVSPQPQDDQNLRQNEVVNCGAVGVNVDIHISHQINKFNTH